MDGAGHHPAGACTEVLRYLKDGVRVQGVEHARARGRMGQPLTPHCCTACQVAENQHLKWAF